MGIFGWSYPPGAANDPYAPYNQQEDPPEWTTATNNARKLFRYFGAKNWGQIYRALYKGTDCGVSDGIAIQDYPEPVYCDELYKHGLDAPVLAIHISSIVEGVDACTETEIVSLTKKGTRKTGTVVKRLFTACDEIEKQARYIWNETHGCDECDIEGEWGGNAINPDCKACKGEGQII